MRRNLFTLSLIGAGLGLAGCSQDAELAACRSDLAVAVTAKTAAQDRVTALEQQLAVSTDRLAQIAGERTAQAPARAHPTSAPHSADAPAAAPAPSPAANPSQPPAAPLSPEQRRTQKF